VEASSSLVSRQRLYRRKWVKSHRLYNGKPKSEDYPKVATPWDTYTKIDHLFECVVPRTPTIAGSLKVPRLFSPQAIGNRSSTTTLGPEYKFADDVAQRLLIKWASQPVRSVGIRVGFACQSAQSKEFVCAARASGTLNCESCPQADWKTSLDMELR
jgi:hypothetical protein